MTPELSVLMPCVPERRDTAAPLYDKIVQQVRGRDVEVLALLDNRMRTIGEKRQALLTASRGRYVCFVDDDDDVATDYIDAILSATIHDPDVVVFPSIALLGTRLYRVEHDISHPNEQAGAGPTFRRKPWHIHPLAAPFAHSSRFPALNDGEDSMWLASIWPRLARQTVASTEPLYVYRKP